MTDTSIDCTEMITTSEISTATTAAINTITSLYVPIVGSAITEEYIKYIFDTKNIAMVDRVDFVFNHVKGRREAFIHINHWKEGDLNNQIQQSLLKKNNYKFYFDENNTKSFWPLLITINPVQPEQRKSNEIYSLEERINALEQNIKKLHIITAQHNKFLHDCGEESDSVQFDPTTNKRKRGFIMPPIATHPMTQHHCHY